MVKYKSLAIFAVVITLTIGAYISVKGYDNEAIIITYERALEMALRDILPILEIESGIRVLQDERDEIRDELLRIESGRLNRELITLARVGNLRSAIIAVNELNASIYLMEASLKLVEENYRLVTIEHRLGVTSAGELRIARQITDGVGFELESLRLAQSSSLKNLNLILGKPLTQFTVVEFDHEEFKTPDNLIHYIRDMTTYAPVIRQLQLSVDRARDEKRAHNGDDRDVRNRLQEAYRFATMRRNQGQLELEAAYRRGLNDMGSLRIQANVREMELDQTQSALDMALTHFELGRATQHDLEQARFRVLQANQNITSIENQKWLLAFFLNNPSLLVVD